MTKQIFEDFVIKGKRDEPVLPPRRERVREEILSPSKREKSNSFFSAKNVMGVIVIGIISLGGFFQLTTMFAKVIIKVTPVSENIVLDDVYTASLIKDENNDSVQYKTMKVEETESASLIAEKSESVSKKASGEIIVYNAYSEEIQRLVANTRFETPEGKVYKIDKAITVPGKKTLNGKVIPGSLVVTVYASEPGEEYNIPASDFTLPGLKGSARYTSVFARGKGDITGGFVGEMKILSPEYVASTKKRLETSILQKLEIKAKSQIPVGYVFYTDAGFVSFRDNSSTLGKSSEDGKVSLVVTGTMEIAIFNEKEMAVFLAKKKLPEIDDYNVNSSNLSGLDFKILDKGAIDLTTEKNFFFKISGNTKIVWDFDTTDFRQDLAGLDKNKYEEIFKKYVMIDKAETIFKPSWSSSFPSDPDRISVELVEK